MKVTFRLEPMGAQIQMKTYFQLESVAHIYDVLRVGGMGTVSYLLESEA